MVRTADIRKAARFFPAILRERNRKSLPRIFYELVYLALRHREIPSFYFMRRLYLADKKNILDFMPNKFLYRLSQTINDAGTSLVLSDKLYFDLYYRRFSNRLPRILAYNHRQSFHTGESQLVLNNPSGFESFLKDMVFKRSESRSVFIKQTYDSYGGRNIHRLTEDDFPMASGRLEDMYHTITRLFMSFPGDHQAASRNGKIESFQCQYDAHRHFHR